MSIVPQCPKPVAFPPVKSWNPKISKADVDGKFLGFTVINVLLLKKN